ARASSTTGPSARPTPVEMMPCTQSTFSCCTSLLKRSIVSLGEDSSSITSSTLRPPMPPLALKRSTAHCAARMPFSPGAAAMPERGARIPIRSGLFWAIAGANTAPEADSAPATAADFRSVRRDKAIVTLPLGSCGAAIFVVVIAMIYQRHVSNKRPNLRDRALCSPASSRGALLEKSVDIGAGQRPVIIQIGDDRLHERLRQRDGELLVAEVVVKDRECQLLRALALVGPLEAIFGEALDLVMLVELLAVDGHDEAVDRSFPFIDFHRYTATVARVNVST